MVSAKGAYNRTKQAPTGGFHDGWQETNIYAGNCVGGCGPRVVGSFIWIAVPLLAISVLLFAWGLEPKRTEAFVGRWPYGNHVLKALAKLDSMLPDQG